MDLKYWIGKKVISVLFDECVWSCIVMVKCTIPLWFANCEHFVFDCFLQFHYMYSSWQQISALIFFVSWKQLWQHAIQFSILFVVFVATYIITFIAWFNCNWRQDILNAFQLLCTCAENYFLANPIFIRLFI